MAVLIQETVAVEQLGISAEAKATLGLSDQTTVNVAKRFAGIEFTWTGELTFLWDWHLVNPDNTVSATRLHRQAVVYHDAAGEYPKAILRQPDSTLHGPSPAEPPEDVTDPETGEVLVAKGSERPALPDKATIEAMPLPNGMTAGELIATFRQAVYAGAKAINPTWADAPEV